MKSHNSSDVNAELSAAIEDNAEEFVVEEIVGKRYNNKTKQFEYLLKWEGYPSEQNTWEPYANLTSCRYLIREYERKLYRRHLRKDNGVLQNSSLNHEAEISVDCDNDINNHDDVNKPSLKSLITLDGSVISSDSPEYEDHIKKNRQSDYSHTEPMEESYETDSKIAETPNPDTNEEEFPQLSNSNSDFNYVNSNSSDSPDLLNKNSIADDAVVSARKTINENGLVLNDNIDNSSGNGSARISPLAPPKKRIFDPSILIESSDTSKIIPEVSFSLLTSTSAVTSVSSSVESLPSSAVSNNAAEEITPTKSVKFELNVDDDSNLSSADDAGNNVIYSNKESSPKTTTSSEKASSENFMNYSSGIYKKPDCDIKSKNKHEEESGLLYKLLTPENRIKAKSSYISLLGSGIYLFDRKQAMSHVNSEPNVTRFSKILVELMQTKKKVLFIPKDDTSLVGAKPLIDLPNIFKPPEMKIPSGTIVQKQTAVSLGIYPSSTNSEQQQQPSSISGGNSTSHIGKPSVERADASFGQGSGTIRTKSSSSSLSEIGGYKHTPTHRNAVPLGQKSNLAAGKMEFKTGTTYGEQNKTASTLRRTNDSFFNSVITSSVDKKASVKTTTANSSLRKLLGTINPGRRTDTAIAADTNDTVKSEESGREIPEAESYCNEDIHMESDFTTELNIEQLNLKPEMILDPLTGIKLTEDDSSASNDIVEESFSSPECIIAASSAVISVRNKSMVALLKKSNNNLDEHDNSIQINFDQSDINYQQALNDGNAAVVLQVDVNNGDVMKSAEQSSSLAVDMASLPYTDAGVINENLVTITGEDGFVYQVENTKVEGGDAIFVSPDEEPQTICVMSDGSKVVRRMRIDGQPIFTLDDAFNNSLVQININERNVLPDGSEIFIGQDETGYTVQISPPGCDTAEQSSEFITDADVTASTISDTLHEGESVNAPAFITGDDQQQEVVATLLEAVDTPNADGSRKVVLMMPDGNLMMTEVDAEQFAALELQK